MDEGRIKNDHKHIKWIRYQTRERTIKWHIQNSHGLKGMDPCASDLVGKE